MDYSGERHGPVHGDRRRRRARRSFNVETFTSKKQYPDTLPVVISDPNDPKFDLEAYIKAST